MHWQHILYSVESGVAHIVLNRPEKLNALGIGPGSNRAELAEAVQAADADDTVGAIVVSAAGRAFCAGGDMTSSPRTATVLDHHLFNESLVAEYARLRSAHKPTVCAVHGLCLGSGMGLIAQFDLVIAADDARFGLVEGRIGHPGATEIVPLVGNAWAKYLMLTGEIIDARRAVDIGLVLETEPASELLSRCLDLGRRLARMPRDAALLNKACINAVTDAMGRANGRATGRVHDTVTKSMSRLAKAPDGRLFYEILCDEGMQALKQARDTQYGAPWMRPLPPRH